MSSIKTILHPTDFSACSRHALELACSLARDNHAHLIVIHVAPPQPEQYGEVVASARSSELKDYLWSLLERLQVADPTVHMDRRLVEGDPAEEIQRLADDSKTDLIVLGTHGRSGFSRLLLGSVAEAIVQNAKCQVVTVKTPLPTLPPLETSPEAVEVAGQVK